MSAIPQFTIQELIEAGVHFGHRTMRWNPRMEPYLYGVRGDIHIINLQQTAPLLHHALKVVHDVVAKNGRVLFVGTKSQASDAIAEAAKRCGQYYVNHRWLGGMLTNWNTVSASIRTLKALEDRLNSPEVLASLTKKEALDLARRRDKLERSLGGIRDMGGRPDLLFVLDTNKENLAIDEADRLGIPVIGIVDSNSDPESVKFPVPGNDDATRAIQLYCRLISDAVLAGIQEEMKVAGVDVGASANPNMGKSGARSVRPVAKKESAAAVEAAPEAPAAAEAAPKKPAAKKAAPTTVVKAKKPAAPKAPAAKKAAGAAE